MIRIARAEDVPAMLEIYAPYVMNTTVTFEYDVPCRKEFSQRFCAIIQQFPWLVWEEDGRILGYAYASRPFPRAAYSWCAEPSIYLRPEAQGRGLGRKLYTALEEILKYQGIRVLYAIITQENTGSVAFHGKMGYKTLAVFPECGFKMGSWLGITWMEKRLSSGEIPKSFPAAFSGLGQDNQRISDILYSLSLS